MSTHTETKRTLADAIEQLRFETGAPKAFVHRVESELMSRGIPLDSDAAPFWDSLKEAFLRDLCKREDPDYIRSNFRDLQATYVNLKNEHERLVEQMREISTALRDQIRWEKDTMQFAVVPGPESIQ